MLLYSEILGLGLQHMNLFFLGGGNLAHDRRESGGRHTQLSQQKRNLDEQVLSFLLFCFFLSIVISSVLLARCVGGN